MTTEVSAMHPQALKAQARERIAHAEPKPLIAGIFYVIIAICISYFSFKLLGNGPELLAQKYFSIDPESFNYAEFIQNFDSEAFMNDYLKYQPTGLASFLGTALRLMSVIITSGLVIFCLNTLRRKEDTSYWNLFDGFSVFLRVLLLYILESFFIMLWAFAFIFPAFIAYYRYSQALYILLDHPEMSVFDCIQESSRIMYGHKWERFLLDFSFIGWFLLMGFLGALGTGFGITFLGSILGIYVYPFYHLTSAGYYRSLTNDDVEIEIE